MDKCAVKKCAVKNCNNKAVIGKETCAACQEFLEFLEGMDSLRYVYRYRGRASFQRNLVRIAKKLDATRD